MGKVKSTKPKLKRMMKTAMYKGEERRIEPVNESPSEYFLDSFRPPLSLEVFEIRRMIKRYS